MKSAPGDSAAIIKYNSAREKFDKTKTIYDSISPMIDDYDNLSADHIANKAYSSGWLKDVEISKLKDDVRNANSFLVMESLAAQDSSKVTAFKEAKEKTEKYKDPLKKYIKGEITLDSTMVALDEIYPIAPSNHDKVMKKISKFNIETSLKKDIEKSDNTSIVWGIIFTAILFAFAYLYSEVFRSPSAYRMANMFKKLQLFSSAAFSIGHGGNDAQKVMGIIGAALIANGSIQEFSQLPNWVPVACYLAIGVGTMSGGWKIVKTMGTKITKVTPLEGVAAETAGAFT